MNKYKYERIGYRVKITTEKNDNEFKFKYNFLIYNNRLFDKDDKHSFIFRYDYDDNDEFHKHNQWSFISFDINSAKPYIEIPIWMQGGINTIRLYEVEYKINGFDVRMQLYRNNCFDNGIKIFMGKNTWINYVFFYEKHAHFCLFNYYSKTHGEINNQILQCIAQYPKSKKSDYMNLSVCPKFNKGLFYNWFREYQSLNQFYQEKNQIFTSKYIYKLPFSEKYVVKLFVRQKKKISKRLQTIYITHNATDNHQWIVEKMDKSVRDINTQRETYNLDMRSNNILHPQYIYSIIVDLKNHDTFEFKFIDSKKFYFCINDSHKYIQNSYGTFNHIYIKNNIQKCELYEKNRWISLMKQNCIESN